MRVSDYFHFDLTNMHKFSQIFLEEKKTMHACLTFLCNCSFWRNHPGVIWGLFGWWGTTVGTAFGVTTLPGTGAHLNLVQALSNTRTDGIGALYREGTASLLNSMVNKNFPYTTSHVKDSFVAAVGSNKAAAAQARVFKLANEGHMKLRN